MDTYNLILKYLNDTYSIRNVLESFPPLNPEEPDSGKSVLAPWSVSSISLNTGLTENEVMEEIEEVSGASVESVEVDGMRIQLLKMGESLGLKAHASHETLKPDPLTISEVMNLHMYQFVAEKVSSIDRPVKIEEAIFDLKNNSFLPDDFMPEHIMGMVEGALKMSSEEIHRAYLLHSETKLLYLFHEQKNNIPGRVRFIYPSKVNFNVQLPNNEKLREKLIGSFTGLRNNEKYRDFENSRLLNTVIFNIESRKNRILKRPVFDPHKISVLESMGYVDKTDEMPKIRDNISVGQLKEKKTELKKHGEELSKEWFQSIVHLEN